MGQGMARQVFFSGNAIPLDLALRSGLLHETCPAEALSTRVKRQTDAVLKTAPGAVAAAKALCLGIGRDEAADTVTAIAALADRWESAEAHERIAAFLG